MPDNDLPRPVATRRLGPHHFAHLRGVAQGLGIEVSAARYLGIDTKVAARQAHRQVVDQLRGVARRRGDARWRLIGLALGAESVNDRPSLEDWAAARGWQEFGQAELLAMYEEAFPTDRRRVRSRRLHEKQLQVLRDLQGIAAETPQPHDLVEGWFDEATAGRMKRAGMLTLADLRQRVRRGGRWYASMPAIGAAKAARIASYLSTLLPDDTQTPVRVEVYTRLLASASVAALDGSGGLNRVVAGGAGTAAANDRQAIEAWLVAKAGAPDGENHSPATARTYRREAERLLLWCICERGKPLSSMTAEDCSAYMAFLASIPDAWLSRRRSVRLGPGWTPFASQLSLASQQHAVNVVAAFFDWAVTARYLLANPWRLVKRRLGDDGAKSELDSRAFTKTAWAQLLRFVEAQPPSPARARTEFLLHFCEATGLRSAELLAAKLGQFRLVDGRWVLPVHGKGARNRVVAVPSQAVLALERYLAERGLPGLGLAPTDSPLVASVTEPMESVGYRALYDSLKSWFRRAVRASSLSQAERDVALQASLHWLRHTCFTRMLERKASLAATQRQAGHADPRTTMRYAKTQLTELQDEMEAAFGA